MVTNPTQRPWKVTPLGDTGDITVSGPNGEPIAMCGTMACHLGGNGRDTDEANTCLIVLAVNVHEALVAACQAALPGIESIAGSATREAKAEEVAGQLRAALTLAGETPK